jgi:capsular exopolysaccharide synthesis family protein
MGRMHDALKKAEEERKKRRQGEAQGSPTTSPMPVSEPAPKARVEMPRRPSRPSVETAPIELPEPESRKSSRGIAAGLERARQSLVEADGGRRFGELLLTLHSPADQRSEQIRAIRTNILSLKKVPQVLALTSAVADEGAGMAASNLAVCFGEDMSQKVLLVDGDLRGSRLRGFFDVASDAPGFTEVLEGSLDPDKAVIDSGLPNLFLVAAGREVENPGGLLSSHSLGGMFDSWRKRFDRIVVVLPPVNEANDAAIIGREIDGILMVVKLGATPRRESEHAIEALSSSGVNVIGCVVTNAGRVREHPGRRS